MNYEFYFKRLSLTLKILSVIGILIYLNNCSTNSIGNGKQQIKPIEIALLFPSESRSDKTNNLSNNLINSARLAVQDLPNQNLILTVYPTSGEQNRAKLAAKAAFEAGANIVVGPLFSIETAGVRETLKNKNIKIISLSNDPTVAGDNVFIMGTALETSANRLVKFALSKGLDKIAVVGPQGNIGFSGIKATRNAIEKQGLIPTAISSYPLNIGGIRESAPRIYQELISSNATAVIFTDTPTRGLGFISEQLHQLYDKNNKRLPQFMGLTRWDSSKQILHESSLNEGWFVISDQRLKKRYQARYKDTFGSIPSEISSLSYDAIALIGTLLQKNSSSISVHKFPRKYFLDQNGFVGINGIFRFKSNGVIERSLSIAEVESGSFKIIDEARKAF